MIFVQEFLDLRLGLIQVPTKWFWSNPFGEVSYRILKNSELKKTPDCNIFGEILIFCSCTIPKASSNWHPRANIIYSPAVFRWKNLLWLKRFCRQNHIYICELCTGRWKKQFQHGGHSSSVVRTRLFDPTQYLGHSFIVPDRLYGRIILTTPSR